jgi:hypothetical protein
VLVLDESIEVKSQYGGGCGYGGILMECLRCNYAIYDAYSSFKLDELFILCFSLPHL